MGETLEYLESLYEAGDFDELVNNGECLADWGIVVLTPTKPAKKGRKCKK